MKINIRTILSFITTSWLVLEVLYTMVQRYHWDIIIFDVTLGILIIVGIYLPTKNIIRKKLESSRRLNKKILLVEDEKLVRQLICENLKEERSFHITHQANNGKEALELLEVHKFDMVITDIDMPEMNGLELCKFIKRDYPDTNILMLTMSEGIDKLESIIRSGANGYVDKEFMENEIKNAINSVLSGGCYYSKNIWNLLNKVFRQQNKLKCA